ncbi:TRAP transporter substrate-binding protein DctP [Salipiger sp.]|uniref:TRAP transporter substrate-binding protein DctP n=1 Tax=Salipiger sp. TaxID=2078585 RepID=UPI003A97ADC9
MKLGTSALRMALAAVLSAGLSLPALADEKIELTFSTANGENTPVAIAMKDIFDEKVSDYFDFKPYWFSSLVKQGADLVALQRGNIQMAFMPIPELASQVPEFGILGAAYVVRDREHLASIWESDVGDELKQLASDRMGIHLIQPYYYGTRQVNLRGDKRITTPEDMRGIKLRMPGGDAWQFLGKAIGANPIPIAYNELYTALQTGVIDGQENPLPNDKAAKLYEVTDQIVLTGHYTAFSILAVSDEFWDSLTEDQQRVLETATRETFAVSDLDYATQEVELIDFFKAEGLEVYTPDVAAFQAYAQKLYLESEFSDSWIDGMLDRINAL